MTAKEVEKFILKKDWFFVRQAGSHKIYKNKSMNGIVVIPFHGSKDIPKGTLNSILKKAGLK